MEYNGGAPMRGRDLTPLAGSPSLSSLFAHLRSRPVAGDLLWTNASNLYDQNCGHDRKKEKRYAAQDTMYVCSKSEQPDMHLGPMYCVVRASIAYSPFFSTGYLSMVTPGAGRLVKVRLVLNAFILASANLPAGPLPLQKSKPARSWLLYSDLPAKSQYENADGKGPCTANSPHTT